MKTLKKQVALITGASSGVGKSIAKALAARGVRICVVGRREAELQKLKPARMYVADLTSEKEIHNFAGRLRREFGGLDILVHSAGIHEIARIENAPPAKLDEQYRVNLRAPFVLTQALLPLLRVRRGQIVFVNSSVALRGKAGVSQYAMAKAGLKAFAESLRDEVNPDGIRVLNIFLGRTATPMQAGIYALEGAKYRPELLLQPEDVASVVVHTLGLPRTAEVTEIHIRPAIKSY